MKKKYIWFFNEGNKKMYDLLGDKGVNLHKMSKLDLPVPIGFTISTDASINYINNGNNINEDIINDIKNAILIIEKETGKKLGDLTNPLLLSIRPSTKFPINGLLDEIYKNSTFPKNRKRPKTPLYILERIKNNFSMPGITETILNLGLNDEIISNRIKLSADDASFWYTCYIKLITTYGSIVYGLNKLKYFDTELDKVKQIERVNNISDISISGLKYLIEQSKKIIINKTGQQFPQNPYTQLINVIEAIFKCWDNPIAKTYRKQNNIPDNLGIAISIQSMVFGNKNTKSATGILATRNPLSGENKLFGKYLIKAQGEDIVVNYDNSKNIEELQTDMPEIYDQLTSITQKIENINKYSQEIEFTIENGKLWILKIRNGKTTPNASLKIIIDMFNEGIIDKKEAIMMINPQIINTLNNNPYFQTFIKWLDEIKIIQVGANIYHPEELQDAKKYNADIIGLCRTECLLPNNDTIINSWVYKLVNAKTKKERYNVLEDIKQKQYSDYYTMLKNFNNKIFTFRLSDYPLEEFLPTKKELIKEKILEKNNNLNNEKENETHKFIKKIFNKNPMLGLRGSRLAIIYPELYEIQIQALFEAACNLIKEGYSPIIYIMTSFISHVNELKILKKLIKDTANNVMIKNNISLEYKLGTMIEIPRAALTADEIAKQVNFFSFGTNDLTQMTFAYSRNNYDYINYSIKNNLISFNPFIKLDKDSIGELIKIATKKGKNVNKNLTCGICGIQMRDPDSVKYAIENGMDYISIDTEYIPQAKLIAAQIAIEKENKT